MKWLNNILDVLFPHTCVACGALGLDLCRKCSRQIICHQKSTCPYCNEITVDGRAHERCAKKNGLDGLWIIFPYTHNVKKIIHEAKYRNIRGALKELVYSCGHQSLLSDAKKIIKTDHVIVPIPLADARFKSRGYNQATYIANMFAKIVGTKVDEDILIRTIDTVAQSQLSGVLKRKENISGAFACKGDVKNKTIILVDDVWTSGATVMEACRVLKKNEAKLVYAIVLSGRRL